MAEATGSAPGGTGAGNAQQNQAGQGMSSAPGSQGRTNSELKRPAAGGNPLTKAASQVESDFGGDSGEPSFGDEIENEGYGDDLENDNVGDENEGEGSDENEGEEKKKVLDDYSPDKKYKITVKGQEIEVNGPQAKKLMEQGGRMYQAMEEASTYRKQNDEFRGLFDRIRTNPESLVEFGEALGHSFDKMAHEYVMKKMKYANMSEVEQKLHDREQELQKYKSKDEQSKKQQEEHAAAQRLQVASQKAKGEVFEFFSQKFDSKQMQSPTNLKLLADTLENVLGSWDERTGNRMPVAKAFEIVQNRIKADRQTTLQDLSDEELAALPDDHPLIKKIRQRDIQRYKSRQSGRPERTNQSQQQVKPRQPQPQKNVSIDDLFANIEKRLS